MKKRQYGKIVFTSSAVAIGITSVMHPYCAAKAGVLGLMYSMALELAPYHIRVNAVLPDLIGTEFYGPPSAERDANLANRAKVLLMGRVGTPEDIAGPTLFLASDLSAYVTGIYIFVGGKYPAGQVPNLPSK
jgi:NAD(P)-dependent dehydrogenase (short-subunit alcohol dehydrogenase family)